MSALVVGVDLLTLDAGNTVVFLDHGRIARFVSALGFSVDEATLVRTEGEAKISLEDGGVTDDPSAAESRSNPVEVDWAERAAPGARGWGLVIGTMLHRGGVPRAQLASLLDALWIDHRRLNLYSLVPDGLGAALDRLRARGFKVAILSNSEGMLAGLFERLGLLSHIDLVVDSGTFGVEKPDPRIFQVALGTFHVAPERALHLGDTYATDVVGARAASMRTALIDPHGHYVGRFADVPRVDGVVAVAEAMLASRDG